MVVLAMGKFGGHEMNYASDVDVVFLYDHDGMTAPPAASRTGTTNSHFFGELATPRRILLWNVTGINMLPLLMGFIFFVQQKYMSPPPSPSMTKEQIQQQKIMKIMMVVMFPLMLYSAPSGLTLYILTSSTIGIFESRYIRSHIKDMDDGPADAKRDARKKKTRDPLGRAYAQALERAEEKRRSKQQPQKTYKKRKR